MWWSWLRVLAGTVGWCQCQRQRRCLLPPLLNAFNWSGFLPLRFFFGETFAHWVFFSFLAVRFLFSAVNFICRVLLPAGEGLSFHNSFHFFFFSPPLLFWLYNAEWVVVYVILNYVYIILRTTRGTTTTTLSMTSIATTTTNANK